jgi:hypothetical protein
MLYEIVFVELRLLLAYIERAYFHTIRCIIVLIMFGIRLCVYIDMYIVRRHNS